MVVVVGLAKGQKQSPARLYNNFAAAAWFLLLCALASFASYMLLYAAS